MNLVSYKTEFRLVIIIRYGFIFVAYHGPQIVLILNVQVTLVYCVEQGDRGLQGDELKIHTQRS